MKKILVVLTALVLLLAMTGCDLFGPKLDLVDVKDLPSFSSAPVDSEEAALAAVLNSGMLLAIPMESLGEEIGAELENQMSSIQAAILSHYLAPSFSLSAQPAVVWEDSFTESGNDDKGSESGSFSLEISNEKDEDSLIQLDGTAKGKMNASWDFTGNREKMAVDADADTNFRLRVLKDVSAETYDGDTMTMKRGSVAHFIASIKFDYDIDHNTDTDAGTLTASYDSRVQFGYTMTLDGVDGYAGKFVLVIDLKEKSKVDITYSDEMDLNSKMAEQVTGEFESFGTLKVYNNSNTLLFDIDLTDDKILEIMMEM
ncbi:hypothetical protein [Spirochaeta dissipatitropha]